MTTRFRKLENGRGNKNMKLGVVAAVAFSASCTSEPMTEQGMDMAKPSVDMNESADMKMCPNRCST